MAGREWENFRGAVNPERYEKLEKQRAFAHRWI